MADLDNVRRRIASHCEQIETLFKRGALVTVIVRNPRESDADVIVSSDDLGAAAKALEDLRARTAGMSGSVQQASPRVEAPVADQAPETGLDTEALESGPGFVELVATASHSESDLRASRARAADLQGEIAQLQAENERLDAANNIRCDELQARDRLLDAERSRLIRHNNEEQDRRREAERQVAILRDRADRAEEGLRISKLRNDELHVEAREIVEQRAKAEQERDAAQLLAEHRGELLERSQARLTGLVYAWASLHDEHCGRPKGFCDALQRIQRLSGVAGEEPPSADAAAPAPSTPTTAQAEHVCGLTGYNGMVDPPCPGCVERRS